MITSRAFSGRGSRRGSSEWRRAHDAESVGNATNESDEDTESSTSTWVRTLNLRILSEDSEEPQPEAVDAPVLTAANRAVPDPLAHHGGRCRPCIFFATGRCGASNGCRYCHEFHPKVPERRLLRRVRKITRDMIKGNLARIFGQETDLDNLRDELQTQAERHHLAWVLIQNHLRERQTAAENVG